MSHVFVWRFLNEDPAAAQRRLDDRLAKQAASLSESFGRSFSHVTRRVGDVVIGQVHHATSNGVRNWQPWVDHDSCGLAWSGVCEDLLGVDLDEASTQELHATSLAHPERIGRQNGNFLLISWSEADGRVCITTGDTMSPPLWSVSGPDGWACGSRVAPLFELVGTRPRLDRASTGLFLTFSYHISGGTFFAGTDRIGVRRQVVVRRGEEPTTHEYLSVPDFLASEGLRPAELDDAVQACADVLVDRVGRQLEFSDNPHVELSGGRDSRCVAAAIYRTGTKVTAHTGGAPGSPEVRIARTVADALGFGQSVETLTQDRLSVLLDHPDEASRWLGLSEGLETIRQGLHWEPFFQGRPPVFPDSPQFFSGMHFGMLKSTVAGSPAALYGRLPGALADYDEARAALAVIVSSANEATADVMGDTSDPTAWAHMSFYQTRCSIWGANVMSVKFPAATYWLPLIDATVMRWAWRLLRERKASPYFVDGITRQNAPHVASIAFANAMPPRRPLARVMRKAWNRLRRHVLPPQRTASGMMLDHQSFPISPRRTEMWQAFFAANSYVWRDLIDEDWVADLVVRQPNSQLLWNLATTELVAQEFF